MPYTKKSNKKSVYVYFEKFVHFIQKLEISVAWKFQLLRNLRYLGINNFIQSYEYFKKYFEYEKNIKSALVKNEQKYLNGKM